MTAKFASTLRKVPWYLLLKGGLAGSAWFFLPLWLFTFIALFLYFIPFFDATRFSVAFLIVLFVAFSLPKGFLGAVFIALLMVLLMGTKDLVFIHRSSTYQALVLLLFLASFSLFFRASSVIFPMASFVLALGMGILFFLLFVGFLRYERFKDSSTQMKQYNVFLLGALGGFLIWQFVWVLLFLPLHFFHQAALLFLVGVLLFELFIDYEKEVLSRRELLVAFSLLFVFAVFILAFHEWKL